MFWPCVHVYIKIAIENTVIIVLYFQDKFSSICQAFKLSICQSVKLAGEAGVHGLKRCMSRVQKLSWNEMVYVEEFKSLYFLSTFLSCIFSSFQFHSISISNSESSCFFTSRTSLLYDFFIFTGNYWQLLAPIIALLVWKSKNLSLPLVNLPGNPLKTFPSLEKIKNFITLFVLLRFRSFLHHSKALFSLIIFIWT